MFYVKESLGHSRANTDMGERKKGVRGGYMEYQRIMEVYSKMRYFYDYDFGDVGNGMLAEEAKGLECDLGSNRVQLKLWGLKCERAREVYGSNSNFNFELFNACCQSVIRRKMAAEAKKQKKADKLKKGFVKDSKISKILAKMHWQTAVSLMIAFGIALILFLHGYLRWGTPVLPY